jgi:uncharacterized protein (DUF983 family)
MLTCPECGSSALTLRQAESSPAIRWYKCNGCGYKFPHKSSAGKAAEFAPLVLATAIVGEVLLGLFGGGGDGGGFDSGGGCFSG